MRIIDLEKSKASLALCCESLGGYHLDGRKEREKFLVWHLERGAMRGKVALEEGNRVGWINYYPTPDGWYRIGCVLVDVDCRGKGVGRALMKACLADCRDGKGITVGATVWEHMPKSFFTRMGFVDPSPQANTSRMVFAFKGESPPATVHPTFVPELVEGGLVVDMFDDGECPTSYVTRQLVKEAATQLGDILIVREHDMKDEEESAAWGNLRGIFLNGKEAFFGYPGELPSIRDDLMNSLKVAGLKSG